MGKGRNLHKPISIGKYHTELVEYGKQGLLKKEAIQLIRAKVNPDKKLVQSQRRKESLGGREICFHRRGGTAICTDQSVWTFWSQSTIMLIVNMDRYSTKYG